MNVVQLVTGFSVNSLQLASARRRPPLILTEYPREASLKLTSLARARCVLKKIDQPVLCTAPRAYVNRPREIAEETERSRRRINDLQAERDALGIVG